MYNNKKSITQLHEPSSYFGAKQLNKPLIEVKREPGLEGRNLTTIIRKLKSRENPTTRNKILMIVFSYIQ